MVTKTSSGVDLAEIAIFSELSKRELKAVSRLMTELTIKEGATLTRQGEPGQEFMIISSGTAMVEIDGQTVAHLAAGEFLGELAVISGTPRTATVTATSPMIIEILNRREFMALLDESATLGRKILVGAVKRLQMNERTKTN
ncbi:MAG: cyclic nucleotide-binding domain-containing protein [Acidimicrobiaceae bacterium]|nr:cyclic nucleotide-binding domain-containing protein [Acidimicrobiaceae bacterium]MDB4102458.1 cyclic nucleotide-binding domain-containing protein [Acidimicrobiales bacterium]